MREDFAETIANYITRTDEDWEQIYKYAARGWEAPEGEDDLEASVYYCWYYYENNDAANKKSYAEDGEVESKTDEKGNVTYYLKNSTTIVYPVEDKDGVDGVATLKQKINVCRTWFKDEWGLDLDALREEVQKRQKDYDIEALRKQVEDMQ